MKIMVNMEYSIVRIFEFIEFGIINKHKLIALFDSSVGLSVMLAWSLFLSESENKDMFAETVHSRFINHAI